MCPSAPVLRRLSRICVSVESQSVVSVEEYGECCETETENALSAHERRAENRLGRGLRSAPTQRKRPPTEATLLPGYAALFTHELIVSVDLASKSRPAASEIFKSLGFSLTLRQFHQA